MSLLNPKFIPNVVKTGKKDKIPRSKEVTIDPKDTYLLIFNTNKKKRIPHIANNQFVAIIIPAKQDTILPPLKPKKIGKTSNYFVLYKW